MLRLDSLISLQNLILLQCKFMILESGLHVILDSSGLHFILESSPLSKSEKPISYVTW